MIKNTEIYVHADGDSVWQIGKKLKIKGEALSQFGSALCEIRVTIEVETRTGKYKIINFEET